MGSAMRETSEACARRGGGKSSALCLRIERGGYGSYELA